ncbi:porin [Nibrella saemangeumensis]|uniref:Porin n=1 Tax=Nibrella saemangeumensis TaxID=1084526 RepID=A0ABP8N5T7_9BACT
MVNYIKTGVLIVLSALSAFGQATDTTRGTAPTALLSQQPAAGNQVTFSGYVEAYYAYDFTVPGTVQERPGFLYNFTRNREVNLNLAFLRGAYTGEYVRANLALQVGTYPQYNYASEQDLVKNIFEAYAGVKLSRNRDLWLDVGLFSSHIGYESAIGQDNWTLTRSIVAENSPYYLAGARLTYTTSDGKWTLLGSVLNGWQRVRRLAGYSGPSFGTQVQCRPSSRLTLNWSTFLGSDRSDSLRSARMYHNFYAIYQPGKVGLTLGFDVGSERKPVVMGRREGRGSNVWFTPTAVLRYRLSEKLRLGGRVEYYDDKAGVMITPDTATETGSRVFQTWGYSANIDYAVSDQALFRVEARTFRSKDAVFQTGSGTGRTNTALTTSLSVRF